MTTMNEIMQRWHKLADQKGIKVYHPDGTISHTKAGEHLKGIRRRAARKGSEIKS